MEVKTLSSGQALEGCYLLTSAQVLTTRTGKPYGALRLGDASGEVAARLWDQAEELMAPLAPGQVVRVTGRVETFNGQVQAVLTSISPAPEENPAQFAPQSPVPASESWAVLDRLVASLEHPALRKLMRAFFKDPEFRPRFDLAPAAKGAHHAYVHGLLEHTASVARLADQVARHYPHLDRDLLLAGAMLHDVGKADELTLGPPIDYTDEGRLEGHLVLGVRMLDRRLPGIKNFPPAVAAHLRHMLLSHHGLYEFGSPRRPKTGEAMALHLLDDLDAKLNMIQAATGQANGDSHWTGFNRLLERFLYAGPSPWEEEPPQEPPQEKPEALRPPSLFEDQG